MSAWKSGLLWFCRWAVPGSASGRKARMARAWKTARKLYKEGRYAECDQALTETLVIAEEPGAGDRFLMDALDKLADFHKSVGSYSKAEPLYLRSLALKSEQLGELDPETLKSMNDIALLHYAQGKNDASEKMYRQLIPRLEAGWGEQSRELATALNNLGALLRRLNRNEESAEVVARARRILRKTGKN